MRLPCSRFEKTVELR